MQGGNWIVYLLLKKAKDFFETFSESGYKF